MNLKIIYATNERKRHTKVTFSFIERQAELSPIRIVRSPCGSGAASNRYYYQADFVAPADAAFAFCGVIRTNIWRKLNPQFNPKRLCWIGNVAELSPGGE